MKEITIEQLSQDVLDGEFLGIPLKLDLIDGRSLECKIDEYTYDDEPFMNYVVVGSKMIAFEDIKSIHTIE